ncbi:MAG: nucleotidyltransferase family protein [Xanthomonadales bacterium]|jgi:molybdenum cofactor cytidylyltransferase|nr:nucleotidyltransferase family protein [Xanthomonadales bacterium]
MTDTPGNPSLGVVLLAAGPSTRLGQPKQLVEVGGECLVSHAARLALSLDPTFVTVVTGCEADRIEAELEQLPVGVVYNRNWSSGMGASINCGVRSIHKGVEGVLVMVCDQWRLEESDLERLFSAWSSDISRIVVASWKEETAFVSGPPVIFPRKLIPELKSMQENRGARQLIDRYMDLVDYVEMENAAHDLDRPEDLERLRNRG